MIRRAFTTSLVALALALALPSQSNAQVLHLGAGLTVPIGDYGDVASTGWMGNAAVHFNVGENGLWGGVEGNYGRNATENDLLDESFKLFLVTGVLGYHFHTESSVLPYIYAGGGLLSAKLGDGESDSDFALQAGVGATFGSSSLMPFLEAELVTAGSETQWFAVNGGISIGLGN